MPVFASSAPTAPSATCSSPRLRSPFLGHYRVNVQADFGRYEEPLAIDIPGILEEPSVEIPCLPFGGAEEIFTGLPHLDIQQQGAPLVGDGDVKPVRFEVNTNRFSHGAAASLGGYHFNWSRLEGHLEISDEVVPHDRPCEAAPAGSRAGSVHETSPNSGYFLERIAASSPS